jgi:hypothetical protein
MALVYFELILYKVKDRDLVSVFCKQIPSFSRGKEAVFSLSYVLGTFVKNQVGISAWIHIWVFYCVLLVFITLSVPVPCFYIAMAL